MPLAADITLKCPHCDSVLDPHLPGGSCAACLWGELIAGEMEEKAQRNEAPEIDGYEVEREIGRGGMGVVYLARQLSPAREVALKIVGPYSLRAAQDRLRFMVEIEAMAAVTHPAVLPLFETGEDEHGRPWFTMQLANAGSLAERIDVYTGQWERSAKLLVTLAEAVQYAHERGILHRDLKPANVLFDEQQHAYVADFGLAKWAEQDADLTNSMQVMGTPAYMAPEAALGGAKATTTASDVYGLGAMLYELLTGARLYTGANAVLVLKQILDQDPLPPRQHQRDIPRDLEMITLKALSRDPARRYGSAGALAEDLTRWLEGKPILARPVGPVERLWLAARRHPAVAALSLLLIGSIAIGGVLLWWSHIRLKHSENDAMARVEFMTHELPASLQQLGRLDLLDSVFQNVAEHYELGGQEDSVSLAREADFLTQWSQILRPRGQNIAAIQRLQQAMEKARKAMRQSDPSELTVRAYVTTAWRLGEALIEGKRHEEAEAALREAAAVAANHPPEDIPMSILDAQISLEMGFLGKSRLEMALLGQEVGETTSQAQVQHQTEEALRKWKLLLPSLEKPPISPNYQNALVTFLHTYFVLADAAREMGNKTANKTYLTEVHRMTERLIAQEPDNAHFRSLLIRAKLWLAKDENFSPTEVYQQCLTAQEEAASLTAKDPGNARWLTDAVWCAHEVAEAAVANQDTPAHHHWRAVMAKRLDSLYQMTTTDLEFLRARAIFSRGCARLFLADDWPNARHHYEAALAARTRMAMLTNTPASLDAFVNSLFEDIRDHEGEPAAQAWLTNYRKLHP